MPNKNDIYEAWKEYKEKATSTAQPVPLVESEE